MIFYKARHTEFIHINRRGDGVFEHRGRSGCGSVQVSGFFCFSVLKSET